MKKIGNVYPKYSTTIKLPNVNLKKSMSIAKDDFKVNNS